LKPGELRALHVEKWIDAKDKVSVRRAGMLIVTDLDLRPTTIGVYFRFLSGVIFCGIVDGICE
jgi:hypothetical protein